MLNHLLIHRSPHLLLVFVLPILLLSACTTGALSIDVEVTLYSEEAWKTEVEIVYAAQQVQMMGSQLDQGFATILSQWEAEGIQASMRQNALNNGNVIYSISANGRSYSQLNGAFFDNTALIKYDGGTEPPQISFSYAPFGSFFSLAVSRKFTLKGGEILTSNGSQVARGTVTWFNPLETMQATLTPAIPLNLGAVLAGVGGVIGLAGLLVVVRANGRKRCWNCHARIPRRAEFCTECGVEV